MMIKNQILRFKVGGCSVSKEIENAKLQRKEIKKVIEKKCQQNTTFNKPKNI